MKFKTIDNIFKISLILKALNGFLEIIGGILILFINKNTLVSFFKKIFANELIQDPKDIIANYLISLSQKFSLSSQIFLSIYLLVHGIIKIFLIIALLKRKIWGYPIAIAVFTTFILYQTYLVIAGFSFYYLLLTILDLIVIILTFIEYRHIKKLAKN